MYLVYTITPSITQRARMSVHCVVEHGSVTPVRFGTIERLVGHLNPVVAGRRFRQGEFGYPCGKGVHKSGDDEVHPLLRQRMTGALQYDLRAS